MADAQDLHQIEYRHHQTRDLSPVATSMTSRESLSAWDSRIHAWVRHPHADPLSESACYQVFPSGQAALAWRYRDERAASRQDGTRGRPLVSRVLVGSASVLTFEVAVASSLAGPSADWLGPLPGQVPEDTQLPTVSGAALTALTRAMTLELDQVSATQPGLQAVVAAALAEPSIPLAISLQDTLIHMPPREGMQYPLLWGLRGIAGPLLGQAGRGWSFSTFELPLGETDPASLPAIVFREARAAGSAPPSRWRREAKVRPLEAGALDDGTSYAELAEVAGLLVTEYGDRGGHGLEQFIAECGGGAGSFPARMGRVSDALRKAHHPPAAYGYQRFAGLMRPRPPAGPAEPEAQEVTGDPRVAAPGRPGPEPAQAVAREPEARDAGDSRLEAQPPGEPWPGPQPAPARADVAWTGSPDGGGSRWPDADDAALAAAVTDGHGDRWEHADLRRDRYQSPDELLSPAREGQLAPPLALPDRDPAPARPPSAGERGPARGSQEPVSSLLRRLELLGEDQPLFESILDGIHQSGGVAPEERARSWDVISGAGWYENICQYNSFRSRDLAGIFFLVVVPELAEQPPAEVIARWAVEAPVPMVEGLLAAATAAGPDMWNLVMEILEPALAYRWARENYLRDRWDGARAVRPHVSHGRDDGKGGIFGKRRRPGRR